MIVNGYAFTRCNEGFSKLISTTSSATSCKKA
ncbi:hypothetical protein [Oribacterium sinus]